MGSAENMELFEAQSHIWNHIFSFINSMSLKSAIELGIPDIIHRYGKPMTLDELTKQLPINHIKDHCVYRLMRILTHSGFFTTTNTSQNDNKEGYLLTPASKLLLKDEPMSVSPFLLAMLDPVLTNPWDKLSEWFQNDDPTPFVTTHGARFWELESQNQRFNNFFNEAMASDARFVSRVLIEDYPSVLEGISSLVDVGGGTGTMAKVIADAFPNLKCSVLDLPHVVNGLDNTNINFVGGDMFQSIPPADALLLKWIMHDWSDEECVEILINCKEAIPSKINRGKVMIIDMVLDKKNKSDAKAIETQLFFDMLMLVLVKGKERTEEEWSQLFFKAGFTDYKITPMFGLRSLIEWIMQNWSDEECVAILIKCKEAIPSKINGGKVMIIDMVLDKKNKSDTKAIETQLFLNMLMLVIEKGKERTEEEWSQLFFKAGFTDYKITPIFGLRSLIEVFY